MKRSNLLYRIECRGANIGALISQLAKQEINLFDLFREKEILEFSLVEGDYQKLLKMELSSYQITVKRLGGIKYLKCYFLSRCGMIMGLLLSIILYIFMSNRLFYINIIGNDIVADDVVLQSLDSIGIRKMSLMPIDTEYLEAFLLTEFDFSLVSVVIKGNSLIINVKEEVANINEGYSEITAEYDMVIQSIDVYAGTSNLKAGDIVKKGDILVYPYVYEGENRVDIQPKAKIRAIRYISQSYTLFNEEEVRFRSGEKQVVLYNFCLGDNIIYSCNNDVIYTDFEIEEQNVAISMYYLPLRIKKIIAYELVTKVVVRDYETEKDFIIHKLKSDCYSLCKGSEILSEKEHITKLNYGYVFNYHIAISLYLDY